MSSLAFLLVADLVGFTSAARAEELSKTSDAGKPIEGSWIFSVKGLNGSYSFTAVASFAAGGVFLATGSVDRIMPVSPLHGTWRRAGHDRFDATADFFGFDPAGNGTAMLHVVQSFELNDNGELIGVGEFSVCDLQGESCHRTPETDFSVTARRIVATELTDRMLPPI